MKQESDSVTEGEMVTLKTLIESKSSQTLLEFLVKRFHYLNQREWQERIQDGRVMVNDHQASDGQPLRAGDTVSYITTSWKEPEVNKNYRVVYEDETLLVISKPAPLPVHAIGSYFQNTLMHLLRKDRPEADSFQLIHRLDSETSGLLLLVKERDLVHPFQKSWNDNVRKAYRAIVFGKFPSKQTRVDAPIGLDKKSAIRMKSAVDLVDGKASVTEFSLIETRGDFSLIEARILTGRTHQIRVHLEYLKFPIVGDKLYSGTDETFLHFRETGWDDWLKKRVRLPRMALHACRLEFTHVRTGAKHIFEDKMPDDLTAFWEGLSRQLA